MFGHNDGSVSLDYSSFGRPLDFRKGGGLRRQGDFILPEYVEKALADLADVSDVCVYGIPAESGAPGESDIVAAVVLAPGIKLNTKKIYKELTEKSDEKEEPKKP